MLLQMQRSAGLPIVLTAALWCTVRAPDEMSGIHLFSVSLV